MRRLGYYLLVAVGLLVGYYALTFGLVAGWLYLGDRLPAALGLAALIGIPATGLFVVLVEKQRGG